MNEELRIQQERYNSNHKVMVEGSHEFADALIENVAGYSLEDLSLSYNLTNILVQAGFIPKNGHIPLMPEDRLRVASALNGQLRTLLSHDENRSMIWLTHTSELNEEFPYMVINVDLGDSRSDTAVSQEALELTNKIMNTYLNMIGKKHGGLITHLNRQSLKYPYTKGVTNMSGAKDFFMEALNS